MPKKLTPEEQAAKTLEKRRNRMRKQMARACPGAAVPTDAELDQLIKDSDDAMSEMPPDLD